MRLALAMAFQAAPDEGPNWWIVAVGVVIVVALATVLKSRGGIGATGQDESREADGSDLL